MPPQPLSRVHPNPDLVFGSGALEKYPNHCHLALECISEGAQVEYEWASVLVAVLDTDANIGMAMYEALSGAESRRAALLGAAQSALSEDDFFLLKAVEKAAASARGVRNTFVHHVWAVSGAVPDCLLLIDPKCFRDFFVAASEFRLKVAKKSKRRMVFDHSLIGVWKLPDLKRTLSEIREAHTLVAQLRIYLTPRKDDPEIGVKARQRLLSQPQVSQALRQLNKQKTPPARP